MLAKKVDRRIILVVNILSSLFAMLFMIAIGKFGHPLSCQFCRGIHHSQQCLLITKALACYPESNLRLLWLTGLFDFVGGGEPIFLTLLRSIIAESVEANRL